MFNVIPRWALVLGIGAVSAAGVITVAPAASASSVPSYGSFAPADQVGEVVNGVTKAAQDIVGANANGAVSDIVNGAASAASDPVNGAAGTVNDAVNGLLGVNLGL